MLRQIILWRLFTHLIWPTLFATCSITYNVTAFPYETMIILTALWCLCRWTELPFRLNAIVIIKAQMQNSNLDRMTMKQKTYQWIIFTSVQIYFSKCLFSLSICLFLSLTICFFLCLNVSKFTDLSFCFFGCQCVPLSV